MTINISENSRPDRDIDLVDVLRVIKPHVIDLIWESRSVEYFGTKGNIVHEISDKRRQVSGEQFMQLFEGVEQTIDGYFLGYKTGEHSPCLVLQVSDGCYIDVESTDVEIIDKVRQSFRGVTDIPL